MYAPTELCILQECLYSANVEYFEYSGVRYMFLPLDVSYFSETVQSRHTPPLNPRPGDPSRCKGGPLLLVKGRMGWRKGRIRLERAT